MPVEIREHRPGRDLDDFLQVPHEVFRGDPAWVPPLEMELRERLSPRKNPFFEHGEATLFTARKDGRLVGRCSAQLDHEHLRLHEDAAGFFGFFDTVDDPDVGRALIDAATRWVGARGMERLRGPFSLSINEEVGMLVEGFDTPPAIMMPHSRPYQAAVAEAAGLEKSKDLLAWRYEVGALPKRAERAWAAIQEMPEVRIRSVDRRRMESELRVINDVFNDAWSANWGFVPMTEAELKKAASDLKLVIDPEMAFIVEIDGKPVAICVALPNLNEVIRDLGGKLLPFGALKMLWRLKVQRPKSARLAMLGIRKDLRGVKRYGGLSLAMYAEISRRGTARGCEWGELSWTLEDNAPVNLGIRAMGAKVYKKYRVFEKEVP